MGKSIMFYLQMLPTKDGVQITVGEWSSLEKDHRIDYLIRGTINRKEN